MVIFRFWTPRVQKGLIFQRRSAVEDDRGRCTAVSRLCRPLHVTAQFRETRLRRTGVDAVGTDSVIQSSLRYSEGRCSSNEYDFVWRGCSSSGETVTSWKIFSQRIHHLVLACGELSIIAEFGMRLFLVCLLKIIFTNNYTRNCRRAVLIGTSIPFSCSCPELPFNAIPAVLP